MNTKYNHLNFVALRKGGFEFRGFLGNEPRPELQTAARAQAEE